MRFFVLAFSLLLFSCSSAYSTWRTLGYSQSNNITFNDPLRGSYQPPLIELREGFYLWVTPNSSHQVEKVDGKCDGHYKNLNLSFWNNKPYFFRLKESFVRLNDDKQTTISLDNPKNINSDFDSFTSKDAIKLDQVDEHQMAYLSTKIAKKEFEPSLINMKNATWIQLQLTSQVNCFDSSFKLVLFFNELNGSSFSEVLHFFPVTYTKLDR